LKVSDLEPGFQFIGSTRLEKAGAFKLCVNWTFERYSPTERRRLQVVGGGEGGSGRERGTGASSSPAEL
jgi:hypothetical protein